MKLLEIIPAGNTLGEGVLWDAQTQHLWWTDIHERRLFRYDPMTRVLEKFDTPERVGSFGLTAAGGNLVVAFESGIGLFMPGSNAVDWCARPHLNSPGLRFNDGRVDRQGRFWTGTMVEGEPASPDAALYCLNGRRELCVRAAGVSISNGICWSPDSTKFYFADSPLRTIFVYDFDARTGEISNRRVFARTPQGAYPDGANVDSQGFLWSAHWGAGRIVRYAPDGRVDKVVETPASQPTCVAFGGKSLDLMFVTSARDGLNASVLMGQPHAGDVFVYQAPAPGLLDGRFITQEASS